MAALKTTCHKCKRNLNIDSTIFDRDIRVKMDCPFCGAPIFIKMILIYGPTPDDISKFEFVIHQYVNFKAYGYSLEPQLKVYLDNLVKGVEDDG